MEKTDLEKNYELNTEPPISDNTKQYLGFLLDGERRKASQFIKELVEKGTPLKEIYLDIFQRTQREIGYLWETNQISVAEEHYCTAATQMIMTQLIPEFITDEEKDKVAIIACVGGELHELGARMVADFLEMDGWDTYFVGANTPTDSLIETIQKKQPDLVGLSVTMASTLPEVRALIKRINEEVDIEGKDIKILVGGRPFIVSPELSEELDSVDGFAKDVEAAVDLADELIDEKSA